MDQLKTYGWCEVTIEDKRNLGKHMLAVACKLGRPVPSRRRDELVRKLNPIQQEQAHPCSLSSRYSVDEFPIHIDTSHWQVPCRYIVLGCENPGRGERSTTLLDFYSLELSLPERELLFSTPLLIKNGRSSFFGSVLNKRRNFIRFDPGCMRPVSENGEQVLALISENRYKEKLHKVHWVAGKIVIIDNWRVLHGRSKAMHYDAERVLNRVLVV